MLRQGWILLSVLVAAWALNAVSHRNNEESLRSALNAVARKQRSLEPASQNYYNELHAFKYHGGDPERKFERDGHDDPRIDEEGEEIEFLPSETGQLETVGNGFQGLNNKLLERALMDYTENIPEQSEPEQVQSIFRERERSNSRKRGGTPDRLGIDSKEFAKLVLEELQNGSPYRPASDMSEDEYLDTLQMLYDKYGSGQANNPYENSEGPMSWGELVNKEAILRAQPREPDENEYPDRDQDQSILYLSPAERRNVNGRYPIGRDLRTYRSLMKRYPVAKRSAKPLASKKQITDPKVAQDLGALFATQTTETPNDTHVHNHQHDHDHDHDHDHKHDHDHDHDHDHNHDHAHDHTHEHTERNHETTSEAPTVTSPSKGQKENASKDTDAKSIIVRKKSIDWSQYFGIDRRRKKASFMPRQGSQNQDDQWMLQRYYENMAENLRPYEHGYEGENERKEKLEPLDSRLKGIKHMIIETLLRHSEAEDTAELQKLKDRLMANMFASYSLQHIYETLNGLKSNGAAALMKEALNQKGSHPQSNGTSNFREKESATRTDEKRGRNGKEDESEETNCPELDTIEKRCKAADNLAGDGSQMLYLPCVMLQICRACVQDNADLEEDMDDECLGSFMSEAKKVCEAEQLTEGRKGREECVTTAVILSQLQPPNAVVRQCYANEKSCLRRYHYRYRHRYTHDPYSAHRSAIGYGEPSQQQGQHLIPNNGRDLASGWMHKSSTDKDK